MKSIERDFRQYVVLTKQIKDLTARQSILKRGLVEFAADNGEVDSKGHSMIDMEVTDGTTSFLGFQRQRRVSQSFNEERAEILLESKDVEEEDYISYERYVDEEKVARLFALGILSEEEFDSLIDVNETYAFVPVKE